MQYVPVTVHESAVAPAPIELVWQHLRPFGDIAHLFHLSGDTRPVTSSLLVSLSPSMAGLAHSSLQQGP